MFHSFFHFLRLALAVVEDLRIANLLDRLRDLHTGNTLHLVDQSELVGILFLSENCLHNASGELIRACRGRDNSLCGIAGLRLILFVNGRCNACVGIDQISGIVEYLLDLLRVLFHICVTGGEVFHELLPV